MPVNSVSARTHKMRLRKINENKKVYHGSNPRDLTKYRVSTKKNWFFKLKFPFNETKCHDLIKVIFVLISLKTKRIFCFR